MGVAKSLRVLKEPFSPVVHGFSIKYEIRFFLQSTNALFRHIAFRLILSPIRPALSHVRARSPTLVQHGNPVTPLNTETYPRRTIRGSVINDTATSDDLSLSIYREFVLLNYRVIRKSRFVSCIVVKLRARSWDSFFEAYFIFWMFIGINRYVLLGLWNVIHFLNF